MRTAHHALLLCASVIFSACDLCTNTFLDRVPAPSGKYDAVVFTRGCGATTSESVQISIVSSGDNVLDDPVFVADKITTASVEWTSPDELTVRYPAGARLFRTETVVGSVRIRYEER